MIIAWMPDCMLSFPTVVWSGFFCKGCVTLSLVKIPRHLLTCSLMLLFSHERLSPRPPDPHQKTGKFWQKKVQIWRSKRVFVQQMSDCCQNSLHHLHHLGKKEKKKFLRCPWQEKRGELSSYRKNLQQTVIESLFPYLARAQNETPVGLQAKLKETFFI